MSLIKIPIIMDLYKDLKHAIALKEKVDNFSKTKKCKCSRNSCVFRS